MRLLPLLLALALLAALIPVAQAHGTSSQEPFVRTRTVAFLDAQLSSVNLTVGEQVRLTGMVQVLETWPTPLLPPPEVGEVTAYAGGPNFLMKERSVNGVALPGAFPIEKGGLYRYDLTLVARKPGTYHLHPAFASKGSGTLLGPGTFVTVSPSGAPFTNPVTLRSGATVDLENYGAGTVVTWSALLIALGLAWVAWWVRRPLVVRSIKISRGQEEGLVTPADQKAGMAFAVALAVLLAGGYGLAGAAYPDPIRLQVDRPPVPSLPVPHAPADVAPAGAARYDAPDRLAFRVNVTNRGPAPLRIEQFVTGADTFGEGGKALQANPDTVPPGESRTVEVLLADPVMRQLIPVGEPLHAIGGLLVFRDAGGNRTWSTLDLRVIPSAAK